MPIKPSVITLKLATGFISLNEHTFSENSSIVNLVSSPLVQLRAEVGNPLK
jgi:hypothetical protein